MARGFISAFYRTPQFRLTFHWYLSSPTPRQQDKQSRYLHLRQGMSSPSANRHGVQMHGLETNGSWVKVKGIDDLRFRFDLYAGVSEQFMGLQGSQNTTDASNVSKRLE